MGRRLRVEYPGAIYHVMNRGDRKELIFKDDRDRARFVKTLGEACEKTGWQVHTYCLMPNHFHLVIETPRANLVAGVKWLLGTYTIRFNHRHRLSGHLFGGRYKALIVDGSGNGYLKTVCDYVHLNPARAGILSPDQPLRDFEWSSWPSYLHPPAMRPAWLRIDRLFGEHGIPADTDGGRKHLQERVEGCRAAEREVDYQGVRSGWFYGSEDMKEVLLERMKGGFAKSHGGEEVQESAEQHAERIFREELSRLRWSNDELDRRRKGDVQKARIARRLRKETNMSMEWIAKRLRMGSVSTVSQALKRLKSSSE